MPHTWGTCWEEAGACPSGVPLLSEGGPENCPSCSTLRPCRLLSRAQPPSSVRLRVGLALARHRGCVYGAEGMP